MDAHLTRWASFKSILCCIAWFHPCSSPIALESHPGSSPIALESSPLGGLPLELILHIAQFLSPESTLSFCLCCWPIYSKLKSRYVNTIKDSQQLDRYKFLTLLERDLPGYSLCYYCRRLHAIETAHRYLPARDYNRGLQLCKVDFKAMTRIYIHPAFSLTVFHMTIKLYRQGSDYSTLLKLLSHQSERYAGGNYSIVEKCTASSKMVAGSMFIRKQRRFMMPTTQPLAISTYFLTICPHYRFSSKGAYGYRDIMDIVRWRESRGYQNGDRLTKCEYCLTEFRIDFKEFGKRRTAIYVTKWQDLGHGLSPLDPTLWSHLPRDQPWERVEFDLGSICSAFEGKEHGEFEFDSL